MALFFSCLMVGLVVIAVWKRNYKKETIDNILSEGNKKEWLRFLFPMGLWIYDLLSNTAIIPCVSGSFPSTLT